MTAARDNIALKLGAFAVAMKVRAGTLEPRDLTLLRQRLHNSGDAASPLARAVFAFLDILETSRDPARRDQAAQDMAAFIEACNIPVPPDLGRKDIHG